MSRRPTGPAPTTCTSCLDGANARQSTRRESERSERELRHFAAATTRYTRLRACVRPSATTRRVTLPGYTIVNLMELENKAAEGGSTTEARFARGPLDSEHIGLSHFRYAARAAEQERAHAQGAGRGLPRAERLGPGQARRRAHRSSRAGMSSASRPERSAASRPAPTGWRSSRSARTGRKAATA